MSPPSHMPDARPPTVVMPVFNRAALVGRALDSIAAQTKRPAAIICIDDASTDDSVAAIRRWAAAHPALSLTLIQQPTNGGAAQARNVGIRAATTPRVAFLDSDDLWCPHALETLGRLADAHPAAVLVAAETEVIEDGVPRGRNLLSPQLAQMGPGAVRAGDAPDALILVDPMDALLTTNFLPTSAALFDRATAIRAGLMPDFRMGEDWLFFLAMAQHGQVVVSETIVGTVTRHAGNTTSAAAGARIASEHLRAFDALLDGTLPIVIPDRLRPRLAMAARARAADWRWHASRGGWPAYRAALLSPVGRRRGGLMQLLTDPRGALRALLS